MCCSLIMDTTVYFFSYIVPGGHNWMRNLTSCLSCQCNGLLNYISFPPKHKQHCVHLVECFKHVGGGGYWNGYFTVIVTARDACDLDCIKVMTVRAGKVDTHIMREDLGRP